MVIQEPEQKGLKTAKAKNTQQTVIAHNLPPAMLACHSRSKQLMPSCWGECWIVTSAGGVFLTLRRFIAPKIEVCNVAVTALLVMYGMTRPCPGCLRYNRSSYISSILITSSLGSSPSRWCRQWLHLSLSSFKMTECPSITWISCVTLT